jgi:hypothetical protein
VVFCMWGMEHGDKGIGRVAQGTRKRRDGEAVKKPEVERSPIQIASLLDSGS